MLDDIHKLQSGLPSVKPKRERRRPRAPCSYCINTDGGSESSHDITYMWNQKQTHGHRTDLWLPREKRGGRGRQEVGD